MKIKYLFILLLGCSSVLFAQETKEINLLQKKRQEVLKDIEAIQVLIKENKKTAGSVNTQLKLLREQIKSRTQVINLLDQEVTSINQQIAIKERHIKEKEKDLETKKESYAESLQYMYRKRNNSDKLLFIFSADDFAQAFRRILYLKDYSELHKEQANKILEDQTALKQEKETLENTKASKATLLAERKKEGEKLSQEEKTTATEISSLQVKQKEMQATLNKKQKEEEALSKEIQRIIAEEIARAEREEAERKAREEAAKKKQKEQKGETDTPAKAPEQKAKDKKEFSQTKESLALSSRFEENKGKIPFPLKGSYQIVNRFGKHQTNNSPNFDYKGIDILTTAGTDALCVFDGEVITVGIFANYCKYVLVKHGKYYTYYQNFEKVYVKKGDKIKKGQAIGRILTDITKDGTILQFQLHENSAALNPETWLNK